MGWSRVAIAGDDVAQRAEATALMTKFTQAFVEAGGPNSASVYTARTNTGLKVYYFSPEAADIVRRQLPEFHSEDVEAPSFDPTIWTRIDL